MTTVVAKKGSFDFTHGNKGSGEKKKAVCSSAVITGIVMNLVEKAKGPTLLLTQSLTNPLNSASKLQ
jgi:hypothetical protein